MRWRRTGLALVAVVVGSTVSALAIGGHMPWAVRAWVVLSVLYASGVSFAVGRDLGRSDHQRRLERELAATRSINRCLALANVSAERALRREARRRIGELADGREIN